MNIKNLPVKAFGNFSGYDSVLWQLILCHRLLKTQLEFVIFQDQDNQAEFIKYFRSAGCLCGQFS